ncbi:MAG: glycosyltransferase family 39 protein [Proteobacteria bacterium]|nr:glycosyltransferase family 39 protein [Pseudomonadota bacterium]
MMVVCLIAATADDIGWTCDEVYYFNSSELIITWTSALFKALPHGNAGAILSASITDQYWLWDMPHNPHPPLYKIISALTLVLFKQYLGEFTAYRLSSALLCAVLMFVLFRILQKRYGTAAGVCGGLSLLFMPRFFGHAHIAATEIPLTTFWFLACCAFWRGLTQRSGIILLGILWGCAIATKFTGLLLPAPLILWALLYKERRGLSNLVIALPLALLIALLVNPGWWHDPIGKIINFVQISLSRETSIRIPTFFLGKTYSFSPPWTYAWVMTAITVPVTTVFAFILGLLTLYRDTANRRFNNLMFINCLFPLLITMLPNAPVHDGTRQFFYLFPFMAYFSGAGFHFLAERMMAAMKIKKVLIPAALAIFTLYPAYQTMRIHPYELCYYNELVGGVRGAYALGMETTYWYDVVNGKFLKILNRDIPQGAAVSMWVGNQAYFEFLQDKGKIRKDIKFITPDIIVTITNKGADFKFSPETPQYLILLSRQGTFNELYWNIYYKNRPLYSLKLEDIPLISLYRWSDIKLL